MLDALFSNINPPPPKKKVYLCVLLNSCALVSYQLSEVKYACLSLFSCTDVSSQLCFNVHVFVCLHLLALLDLQLMARPKSTQPRGDTFIFLNSFIILNHDAVKITKIISRFENSTV